MDVYSWQETGAFYSMTLDVEKIGQDRNNMIELPDPELSDALPSEVAEMFTKPMDYTKKGRDSQELLADEPHELTEQLGRSGTIVYTPNSTLPSKQDGVAVVELVERHFVAATLIRHPPPDALAQRAVTLADAISAAGLRSGEPLQSYVCALCAWHGCNNMAKLLRRTFNAPGGPDAYTDGMRTGG